MTWDIHSGLYFSGRKGPWAFDFNALYIWNGAATMKNNSKNMQNELSLDWALSRQFKIQGSGSASLAPVLEMNHRTVFSEKGSPVKGNRAFFISPGIQYVLSFFMLEGLVKIPVWHNQEFVQMTNTFLFGIRYLL